MAIAGLRVSLWLPLLLSRAVLADVAPPPLQPTKSKPPTLVVKKGSELIANARPEIVADGLPAILPDASKVAYLDSDYNADESYREELVIESPAGDGAKGRVTVLLGEAGTQGQDPTPLEKVREAARHANELLKSFVSLPGYGPPKLLRKEKRFASHWTLQQGARLFVYSPRSGDLELFEGDTVLLTETMTVLRDWTCCGRAEAKDGGCRRHPERLDGVWGDDRFLMVVMGFKSGGDGCADRPIRRVLLLATRATAPAK